MYFILTQDCIMQNDDRISRKYLQFFYSRKGLKADLKLLLL